MAFVLLYVPPGLNVWSGWRVRRVAQAACPAAPSGPTPNPSPEGEGLAADHSAATFATFAALPLGLSNGARYRPV